MLPILQLPLKISESCCIRQVPGQLPLIKEKPGLWEMLNYYCCLHHFFVGAHRAEKRE